MILYTKTLRTDKTTKYYFSIGAGAGFTLIELLVAMSIMTILFGTITGIFMSVANAQRRVIGMANVQESASFMLESLAKEIRMSTIDPSLSDGASRPFLNITNSDGESVSHTFNPVSGDLIRTVGSNVPQAMNPNNISASGSFYVRKTSFPTIYKVTIFLHVESKNTNLAQKAVLDLETSMTPRGQQK